MGAGVTYGLYAYCGPRHEDQRLRKATSAERREWEATSEAGGNEIQVTYRGQTYACFVMEDY